MNAGLFIVKFWDFYLLQIKLLQVLLSPCLWKSINRQAWDQLFITETGLLARLWTEQSAERHTFITWKLLCVCVCRSACVCKQRHRCVCVALLRHPLHTPVDKWERQREREKATPTWLPVPVNCVHSKYFHSQPAHGNEGGSRTCYMKERQRKKEAERETLTSIIYVFSDRHCMETHTLCRQLDQRW